MMTQTRRLTQTSANTKMNATKKSAFLRAPAHQNRPLPPSPPTTPRQRRTDAGGAALKDGPATTEAVALCPPGCLVPVESDRPPAPPPARAVPRLPHRRAGEPRAERRVERVVEDVNPPVERRDLSPPAYRWLRLRCDAVRCGARLSSPGERWDAAAWGQTAAHGMRRHLVG